MPLVKKTEQFPERPIFVMLVGTPFSRKTSLANTAKNPILIDADRGADRSYGRPDTFVIKEGWPELQQEDEAGLFKGYNTAILDTAKAILDDFLIDYVISKNYKLKTNKMQMYGSIGDEFKLFVNKRRADNMDIIIISHDKTKDEDGLPVINPDITGGSKNLLLRIADQVGYVSNKRVKRGNDMVDIVTVNFTPTQETPFCKNVAMLPEMELPHYTDPAWKDFMEVMIMQPTKDAISKMTDEQRLALEIIAEWHGIIEAIVPADGRDMNAELTAIGKDIAEKIPEEHLQKQVRDYLVNHIRKIGYKWDGKAKVFVLNVKTPPADAVAPEKPKEEAPVEDKPVVVDETPVVDEIDLKAEAAEQRAELEKKAPIKLPEPTGPVINANPHIAPPVNDLFAKKE